jgi:diguanylate cyclase (GGDEF)-like protein
MRHHMREVDIVCRMGGDEFALVLPEADCDEGRMVAERIREQARRAAGDRFAPWGVDFAFGCAAFDPQAPRDLDELLEAADERMYEDKRRRKAARQAPVPGGRTA